MEHRKTNGELGREELSFQPGVMGQSSCTRVYLFSVSVVREAAQTSWSWEGRTWGPWGRKDLLTVSSLHSTEEPWP